MCNQLFTLLLLALSLTLVTCEPIPHVASETLNEDLANVAHSIQKRQEPLLKTKDDSSISQEKETLFILFTDSKKNWYEAFADCRKNGLDLASIENEVEYQQVLSQINALGDGEKNSSFWLSATDLVQNNTYVWMSSGNKLGFSKWCEDEPDKHAHANNEIEHCTELRYKCNYGMNDEICSNNNNYICEIRKNGTSNVAFSEPCEAKKKVFTLVTENKLSWFGALADCKARGLRLATVESAEEQREVSKLINSLVPDKDDPVSSWLGGSDLGRKGDFVWVTSGQPLNYTAWYSSDSAQEPNHKLVNGVEERCLTLRSGRDCRWNDRVCTDTNFYICDNQF